MNYKEKLLDPRWQKKRLEILSRDEFTCQMCGDTKSTLHIHHKLYNNNPWDIDNDKLITYCQHCHQFIEFTKDFSIYNNILKIVKDITVNGIILYVLAIDKYNNKGIDINILKSEKFDDIEYIAFIDYSVLNNLNNLFNNN
jgi:hypothetical protein